MTGIPPAALAVLRAALVDARSYDRHTAEDVAQQLADALAVHGWTIAPTPLNSAPQHRA